MLGLMETQKIKLEAGRRPTEPLSPKREQRNQAAVPGPGVRGTDCLSVCCPERGCGPHGKCLFPSLTNNSN